MTDKTVEIRLLGVPQIRIEGRTVTEWRSRKALALFGYLVMNPKRLLRSQLATLFWGDSPETTARTNLRINLSHLNQLLPGCLNITRETVEFAPTVPCRVDTLEFAQLLASDDAQTLEAAIALWRGELLAGLEEIDARGFWEWLSLERSLWREKCLAAYDRLIQLYLAQGRATAATDAARGLVNLDPLREKSQQYLMTALVEQGERRQALHEYQSYTALLEAEVGAKPAAELTRLHDQIRAGASARPLRHNLPHERTPFVGYTQEVAQITAHLHQGSARLLTLIGLGGSGKTRLAVHVAQQELLNRWDGIYFVALAAATSGELPDLILRALGLMHRSYRDAAAILKAWLSRRKILLVLDNFEQVLDDALQLVDLLNGAPQLTIIVTARERLNLYGEHIVELRGLELPRPPLNVSSPTQDLYENAAVQVFLQTARRVAPRYQPARIEEAYLRELCWRLGGLPLALELMAARIREVSVSQMVAQLRQDFSLLTSEHRDVAEQQRSMTTIVAAAFASLSATAQQSYRQLSLLNDPFEVQTAMALCAVDRRTADLLLAELTRKMLLRRTDDGRYDWHPLIQQDARDHLAANAAHLAQQQQRHRSFFGEYVGAIQLSRFGPRNHPGIHAIERVFNDLATAWHQACDQVDLAFLAATAKNLMLYADLAFRYQTVAALLEEAVHRLRGLHATLPTAPTQPAHVVLPDSPQNDRGRFDAAQLVQVYDEMLLRLARVCLLMTDLDRVDALCQENARLHASAPAQVRATHTAGELRTLELGLQGIVALARGDRVRCAAAMEELMAVAVALQEHGLVAVVLGHYAELASAAGDFVQATTYLTESLAIFRRIDDRSSTAVVLINLAEADYNHRQDAPAALALIEEAATLYTLEQDRVGHAYAIYKKGWIQLETLHPLPAAWFEMVRTSLDIRRDLLDKLEIAATLQLLACAEIQQGDLPAAEDNLYEALRLSVEVQALPQQMNCIGLYGLWAAARGDVQTGAELMHCALQSPACEPHIRRVIQRALGQFSPSLPPETVAAARTRNVEETVTDLLAGILLISE
jgi:DNA-binding SARP family transcriptional activator/predicted ATPase